eukprot:CAMPEP_0175792060 /NCGR_PEP_ID=MMETSP0097-20121207/82774_1 /TAXON_ID=311494 /ORGANISM="Alexandrium monilatum, Strain CCMP3105" /LENGTH=253 /DNA_ID=CAMNT_0017103241 /DNA_START=417 /DNA_END=1179 /DNA_ORIENTATION=-
MDVDGQVQTAIVAHDIAEAITDDLVLLEELPQVRPLHELQRLRPGVRDALCHPDEGPALVRRVTYGDDVLPPLAAEHLAKPVDLALKGQVLPLGGLLDALPLVRGPRRQDLHALKRWEELRQELLAAHLDPPMFGIGHQNDLAVGLRDVQCLPRVLRHRPEQGALLLRGGAPLARPQALTLEPRRGEHGVVPVEDQDGVLAAAIRVRSGVAPKLRGGDGLLVLDRKRRNRLAELAEHRAALYPRCSPSRKAAW